MTGQRLARYFKLQISKDAANGNQVGALPPVGVALAGR